MCLCVCASVCVFVFAYMCVCPYEEQQPIRTLATQNEGLLWHERVCSPRLWCTYMCVCVCDTGGAMATHFLPEEVINAPAGL